jgi:hypothetical protein
MKRRIVNLLTALSLVLCVAVLALWVRSYLRVDVAGRTAMWPEGQNWYWRDWHLWSADGGVRLMSEGFLVNSTSFADQWAQKVGRGYWNASPPGQNSPREPFPRNLWFDLWSQRKGNNRVGPEVIYSDDLNVRVPYWAMAVAAGIAPALWLIHARSRRKRLRSSLCPACGYDLRASPERCPECGTVSVPPPTP